MQRGTNVNESVVVGIDDSEHSARAVEFAAAEAVARRTTLRLVHVFHWLPSPGVPGVAFTEAPMDVARAAVVAMLDDAARKARIAHPGLTVETMPLEGDVPKMLTGAGRGAALLVVGGRGRGGFAGLTLGSVALRTLAMAECPVMVVRGDQVPHSGRIMVGVDLLSPQTSADALEFAFAEARLRKAEVYAINVWEDPLRVLGSHTRLSDEAFAGFEDIQRRHLASVLEPFEQKHPGVVVTQQAIPGTVSQLLVDSTRLVDVLVIGGDARADEKHPGMRIGALAHVVLHHAHCPVIVVPER
jgi:nucleotide-binding universal stress UspA family protein